MPAISAEPIHADSMARDVMSKKYASRSVRYQKTREFSEIKRHRTPPANRALCLLPRIITIIKSSIRARETAGIITL
jgi:hypothetical protein